MKPQKNYWPWAERLIEISMKTLLELNTEFSIISVPHKEKIRGNQIKAIAIDGFEFLDERHVCAKIIQNAMSSFLFSGSWQKEVKPHVKAGFRFWNFYRETNYRNKKINGYCDIILDRTFYDGEKVEPLNQPVYIEAKRAKTKSITDLNTGTIKTTNKYNYANCIVDIEKLIKEKEYVLSNKIFDDMFGHLLIWGETIEPTKDNPKKCETFLNASLKLSHLNKHKLTIHEVRWFPLDRIDKQRIFKNHKVKKWGWVSLMKVV